MTLVEERIPLPKSPLIRWSLIQHQRKDILISWIQIFYLDPHQIVLVASRLI